MSILDRFRLDGKTAIITGASSGLGVAFARDFAEAGCDVVLAARRLKKLEDTAALVETIGRRAVAVRADVSRRKIANESSTVPWPSSAMWIS